MKYLNRYAVCTIVVLVLGGIFFVESRFDSKTNTPVLDSSPVPGLTVSYNGDK